MRQADRFAAILESLSSAGSVGVAEVAMKLAVSEATVRRDLDVLERRRLLGRTHGGAVPLGVVYELPLRLRSARQREEKRRIARAAAERVADGFVIGLTGGTTTSEIARCLVDFERLTVVTNALNIASELAVRPAIKLVVTGGVARSASYELVGPLAEATLTGVNIDLVFVGADGVSATAGLTTHDEVEAHTNRALLARARRVIAVADASKIGRVAFAQICAAEAVDELLTSAGGEPDEVAAIEAAGIAVSAV